MMRRFPPHRLVPALTGLASLAAACGAPAPPPAPPALAWDDGTAPAAVYAFGDTARVDVDAGGRTVEATVSTAATLDVEFRPSPGGVTVSATIRDVSARATHPVAAAETAVAAVLEGPLVFSLDRRGEPTLLTAPRLPEDVARFVSPEVTAATLFPRLPGRAVEPGSRWTDTVRLQSERSGTRVDGTSVVTYTVAGDTLVGGRSLLRVTLEAEDRREVADTRAGMAVRQSLSGRSTGWFLWDLPRGLLHESVYDSELTGSMELQGAPAPLSVRVRSRAEVRLVDVPVGS